MRARAVDLLLTVLAGGTCVIVDRSLLRHRWRAHADRHERVELIALIGDALARPLADELRRHTGHDLSALRMITSSGSVLSQRR